jgi:hypothetical protein
MAIHGIRNVTGGAADALGLLRRGFLRIPPLARFIEGFRDARIATSAFSGAAGTLGGKLRNVVNGLGHAVVAGGKWLKALPAWIIGNTALAASYTAIGIAAAASAFAVYEAVKAAQQMWQAENDLLAQKDANKAAEQDLERKLAEKYGRGSAEYQKNMELAGMGGGVGSFDNGYSHPWYWGPAWQAYDKLRGFGPEGNASGDIASGKIMPKLGGKAGRAPVVHVHIGSVVGTDEAAARKLSGMVGRQLSKGIMRQMVGQNA